MEELYKSILDILNATSPTLGLLSVILALLAIYQATKQNIELRILLNKIDSTSTKHAHKLSSIIDNVVESLSTKHIGEFPVYCTEIVSLLTKATKSIDILCDVPGYGLFSSPHTWVDYKTLLARKISDPDIQVRIITLDFSERNSLYDRHRPSNSEEWNVALKDVKFRNNAINFSQRYMDGKPLEEISYSDFLQTHRNEQHFCLIHDFRHAQKYEIENPREMPIYCWIVDSKMAIFVIRILTDNENLEYGFFTSDGKLVETLSKHFSSSLHHSNSKNGFRSESSLEDLLIQQKLQSDDVHQAEPPSGA